MPIIKLNKGFAVEVSDEDFELLSRFTWRVLENKRTGKRYAVTTMFMHRLILLPERGQPVDHKNGNGLNNKRDNLRHATVSQNNANTISQNQKRGGYKGVSRTRRKSGKPGHWRAVLMTGGKCVWSGYFNDQIEAAKAYDAAAKLHLGEFAKLNFPDASPRGSEHSSD